MFKQWNQLKKSFKKTEKIEAYDKLKQVYEINRVKDIKFKELYIEM